MKLSIIEHNPSALKGFLNNPKWYTYGINLLKIDKLRMDLNKFVCITCGHQVMLHPDHPANTRAKDSIVYRGSCEICAPINIEKRLK